jgi:hypothetical protein
MVYSQRTDRDSFFVGANLTWRVIFVNTNSNRSGFVDVNSHFDLVRLTGSRQCNIRALLACGRITNQNLLLTQQQVSHLELVIFALLWSPPACARAYPDPR